VNTTQLGLKMQGCPSNIGRQGYLSRKVARRVNARLRVEGWRPVHGVTVGAPAVFNFPRMPMNPTALSRWTGPGPVIPAAPRGQSRSRGVGTIWSPRDRPGGPGSGPGCVELNAMMGQFPIVGPGDELDSVNRAAAAARVHSSKGYSCQRGMVGMMTGGGGTAGPASGTTLDSDAGFGALIRIGVAQKFQYIPNSLSTAISKATSAETFSQAASRIVPPVDGFLYDQTYVFEASHYANDFAASPQSKSPFNEVGRIGSYQEAQTMKPPGTGGNSRRFEVAIGGGPGNFPIIPVLPAPSLPRGDEASDAVEHFTPVNFFAPGSPYANGIWTQSLVAGAISGTNPGTYDDPILPNPSAVGIAGPPPERFANIQFSYGYAASYRITLMRHYRVVCWRENDGGAPGTTCTFDSGDGGDIPPGELNGIIPKSLPSSDPSELWDRTFVLPEDVFSQTNDAWSAGSMAVIAPNPPPTA